MTARVVAAACAILAFVAASSPLCAYDVSPPPFLQWFDASYDTVERRTADLWMAGYGSIWLPPPGRADSGNQSVGYDVYDRFDLGYAGSFTRYGTETGLRQVGQLIRRMGGGLYVDLIVNHNGFSDLGTSGFLASGGYPGFFLSHANAIDGDFHSAFASGTIAGRLAGLIDINHATNLRTIRHPVPGFSSSLPAGTTPHFGRLANVPTESNRRFYPDRNLQPIMVFDPSTGEQNIAIYPFNLANPMAGDPVSENAMGYLMRYAQWMVQVIGVDGFRIDAAKHVDGFVFDYLDRAVYRSSFRRHLDGSRWNVFSFSEVYDGNRAFQQTFVRKNIDPNDVGRVGGNRDVLDFPLFFALRDNLTGNGFANDWRNVVAAGMDFYDDGLRNGSQGVMFVQSHDDFGPFLSNVAHAYVLMQPGNAVVYHNAREFGNRDFPKDGRGDALGGVHGDRLTRLVEIRNSHGRGNFRERWLEKELYAFERSGSALVLLSNRLDSGYDERRMNVSFPWGTYLVELTGNAAANSSIPEVIRVDNDCFECQSKVTVRIPRNAGGDRGYLVYGLATPSAPAGIQLTNVSQVLSDPAPTASTNGIRRLADLHVITTDTFQASVQTVPVILSNGHHDRPADGDNALVRIDGGLDLNGDGAVDFRTPGSAFYGFEQFTTKRSPLRGGGDGQFIQTIDATALGEGVHFIEVRAFRQRSDGGPPVYSSFKKAIYIDRLPPNSRLESFQPIQTSVNENRRALVRSVDLTADSVHVLLNLPAALSEAEIVASIGPATQASMIDRDLFSRDLFGLPHGNHVLTIVTFEPTGNRSIERVPGLYASTIGGAGLGDVNHDSQYTAADVQQFESILWSRNRQFNPAADLNADGLIDTRDLLLLGERLAEVQASSAARDEHRAAMLRRVAFSGSGSPSPPDIDVLRASYGTTDWLFDLDADGLVGPEDLSLLLGSFLGTTLGDADLNGRVDRRDAVRLAMGYGGPAGWGRGDFNGDGLGGLADLAIVSEHLPQPGSESAGVAAVPEPPAAALAALAAATLLAYRRRSGCRA